MGRATPLCNAPHVLSLCHIPFGQPQLLVCSGLGHTATTRCGGDQQQLAQSLAKNTRVRGLTSKQWKPMRNHILATHGCNGVSPQSRSCAPGLKDPHTHTCNGNCIQSSGSQVNLHRPSLCMGSSLGQKWLTSISIEFEVHRYRS